ncbi:MAG: amidohydrolase family protein, partial [Gammaproteobacteria bacterium]
GNIGTLHGPSIHREFALMKEAGLTPARILRSATFDAARALGTAGETGAIAVGMRADLVLLDGNPLEDVANLQKVHRVLKDGVVFDPDSLMKSL